MIADSDRASRKALILLLTHKLGVEEVCEAEDAASLLGQLTEFAPDLLLIDEALPGLSIPGTCTDVREVFPAIHIALLSVDELAVFKAGIVDATFIHKGGPVGETLSSLELLLSRAHRNGKASRSIAEHPEGTL
jgi:DNA-binding response OmpR family regulator